MVPRLTTSLPLYGSMVIEIKYSIQFFTTKSGGIGSGLAICFTVAENRGGKLRLLKSDAEFRPLHTGREIGRG